MKDFLIRSFCLAAVILILAGYNQVLKDRSKDEEITKLEAQVTKLQQEKEKDQDHICEKAVEYLENHRTIFENLLRSVKSEEVRKILDDGSSRFFRYVVDSVGEGINSEPEDREMICAMCQHAVQGIMYEWLSREKTDKKSLSDILMRANYLFGGGLERALERSANRSRN